MARTVAIGQRIELVSMDPHFHDISIALYLQEGDEGPEYLVHTYSGREGAPRRIAFVKSAMATLGGLQFTGAGLLRFHCGDPHLLGIKRVFLEACKLDSTTAVEARPLSIFDRKCGRNILAVSCGGGVYRIAAEGGEEGAERRISAIAGGLIKLGEMEDRQTDEVAFSCGESHDALVGLLLVRAPNVRAALREQEAAEARGTLSAPSQQK